MKAKRLFAIISTLAVSLSIYSVAHLRVDKIRCNFSYKLHASAVPFSSEMIEAIAGEFKGIVADYLLLEASSFIGSEQSGDASAEDWNAVTHLLEQSNTLDPYFRQTYRLAQSTLPWYANKYKETLTILKRSQEHLPHDWIPGFFIGFDYFYFLKDNLIASQELMKASMVPGAPASLATWATRLASKAGQTRAALEFITEIYNKTDDEVTKEMLRQRIVALHGVLDLQSAVDVFNKIFFRMPITLDELVDTGLIIRLPENPYNRPYTLKDGQIDF